MPDPFNLAYGRVLDAGHLTLGLMTPLARERDHPADFARELALDERAGRHALLGYLERMAALGVAHMLVNLHGLRAVEDQLEEIGRDVVPRLPALRVAGATASLG